MADTISIHVTNTLPQALTVYTTTTPPVSDPPSTDPDAYTPIYTVLGTVAANSENTLDTGTLLSRIVIARQSDSFPVKLFVPDILGPLTQPVSVGTADLDGTTAALKFYNDYIAQPYSPVALQFNEIVLDSANVGNLDAQVSALLVGNGYPGADYFGFSMVSYWANNALSAWPGTYYCYTVSSLNSDGFIAPPVPAGTLTIADGKASFSASDGGSSYPSLGYASGELSSPGASTCTGLSVRGVYRTMTWEGHPDQAGMFWVGTRDGNQLILQPYQDAGLPWWVGAYNLAFTAFLGVQIAMTVDMAVHVLGGVATGLQWLQANAAKLYQNVRSKLESTSDSADPDAAAGEDVDPVNVDVDVDVDVDIDTDVVTDTDNVTDTDVDVDIDIDVDIDDDVFAVIDVDIDVDVDIDTDVVTDTDNVTDTDVDVDVDVDIDTDVDVPPGSIRTALSKLGSWIITKGFPALVKNLAIMGAMMGTQELLRVWQKSDQEDLQNMSPQEATGFGLLLNYMLNQNVSEQERWSTFADFVQQQQPDIKTQQILLTSILMFKNATADAQLAAWKWPQDVETALEQHMAQQSAPAQQYQAYLQLSQATYQGQALPVKVAAGVANRYLAIIS
ncbi:hypothetical protein IP92_05412 [Pseudoduganella flava]|uniref:Uncharacterized protein n=1 Tax=Pseudoduganella flava TaxID=871742 RepID=A0A562PEL3_9BURK|nr:hypothetical protein [Pseudoduganella flava]TWI42436.1 hypothetical protein IP92_05412 [Pseudoduganella flava]